MTPESARSMARSTTFSSSRTLPGQWYAVIMSMAGVSAKAPEGTTAAPTVINGLPAVLVKVEGTPAVAVSVHVVDGRIAEVYMVRNPEKLVGLTGSV